MFKKKNKILCIGDIILDTYIEGDVKRLSQEAPIPIFDKLQVEYRLGGAANVASNLKSLGSDVTLIGGIGNDDKGIIIKKLLKQNKIKNYLIKDSKYITISKVRYFSQQKQVFRADEEKLIFESSKMNEVDKYIISHDVILLSDYDKGFVKALNKKTLALLKKKIVFVDPKGIDYSKYFGAFLIKPNQKEFWDISNSLNSSMKEEDLVKKIKNKYQIKNMLITKGVNGMTLYDHNNHRTHINSISSDVYDVTGAGDTVISVIAQYFSRGNSIQHCIEKANYAASLAVRHKGNFIVKSSMMDNSKIIKIKILNELITHFKNTKTKIVFTNGVFDIIHAGHVDYLKKAKVLGDILIVGINSDQSVKKNKGNNRPINSIHERIKVLSSIEYVDYIVEFNDKTPLNIIKMINPDFLVKGEDYKLSQIAGYDFVKKNKGIVKIIKFEHSLSTTKILDKIQNL